jgi:hypothetical protein
MQGHHLILGETVDVLSGATIVDTHDERLRQALARLLLEQKGYGRDEIRARLPLSIRAGERCAIVPVDFLLEIGGRAALVIHYGPGSLVTRHRPALAMARLVRPYQIPFAVVTNGRQADVLAVATGRLLGEGLEAIPTRAVLAGWMAGADFEPVAPERAEREARILYAYEVDGSCPCDDRVCRL